MSETDVPRDDHAALCERLSRGFEDAGEFTVIVDKADLRAAIATIREMEAALLVAAERFDQYAELHRLKCTPDGDAKARTNREAAEACRRALAPAAEAANE